MNIKYIILVVVLIFPLSGKAQGNFDMTSISAMVSNAETTGATQLARAAIETKNSLLHKDSKKSAEEYEKASKSLDKYQRCLDYIDILVKGAGTIGTIKLSYDKVKYATKEYSTLLKEYVEYVEHTGRISTADRFIIDNVRETIEQAVKDGKDIWKTFVQLSFFCSGSLPCKVHDLQFIIAGLNLNFTNLGDNLITGCERLRSYMVLRTFGWDHGLYKMKPTGEICSDAISHWKQTALDVMRGAKYGRSSSWLN